MIRFATPVYDYQKHKLGVVLINFRAASLLDEITKTGGLSVGDLMLLNKDSYWLKNQSDTSLEWGFMYPDKKQNLFSQTYPGEWEAIISSDKGQIHTDHGLFTFEKVSPLKKTDATNAPDYFWIIVSHIDSTVFGQFKNSLLFKLFAFGAGLFVIIALGSWFIALAVIRRRLHKLELIEMATRDALTSLPNRNTCFERLKSAVAHASRFKRKLAVLYIDLDGFKAVNDSKGHAAGDELLIKVSQTLISSSRISDTVARLGGDEFVCILSEIDSNTNVLHTGKRIIKALNIPFKLEKGTVSIGASVGIAIFPDHGTTQEELLNKADQAMYASKSNGKNICTIFQEDA